MVCLDIRLRKGCAWSNYILAKARVGVVGFAGVGAETTISDTTSAETPHTDLGALSAPTAPSAPSLLHATPSSTPCFAKAFISIKIKMSNSNPVREFSCYACRQRKVKCDRHEPCANCVRADAACEYIEPTRGKRKRTKQPRESLHAKIARYERMLQKHGEDLTPSLDDGQSSEEESVVKTPATQAELTSRRQDASAPNPHKDTQAISTEPSSRYFDR